MWHAGGSLPGSLAEVRRALRYISSCLPWHVSLMLESCQPLYRSLRCQKPVLHLCEPLHIGLSVHACYMSASASFTNGLSLHVIWLLNGWLSRKVDLSYT